MKGRKFKHMRELREDNDMKQTAIAKYLKVDQSVYSRYENGDCEIPVAVFIRLAYLYDVSVDYLLDLSNFKNYYPRIKNPLD